MGKFLSGLGLTPGAAVQAQALGLSLSDVQELVESRGAQVAHPRLHHYVYSAERNGVQTNPM